jgi:REP element-mobilizing transposase RayT
MKPNTYTQINVHAIFATANREAILATSFESRLYEYMAGLLKNKGHYPLMINGHKDHVHLFFELNPNESLSDLMRDLKSSTSKWINDNMFLPGLFQWQNGYGGFSHSKSQRKTVIEYIENQKEHHKKETFRDEYLKILKEFEIDFRDEYLFQFW